MSHQWAPAPGDTVVRYGLRTSSPWRTWCDLAAAGASESDLVILADAVRREHGGRALEGRLREWGSRRGSRTLRAAMARSRDRVDSPMETRMRLLLVDGGPPEPLVNESIVDVDGTPLHRPDLSWAQWRVAVDYDGAHHDQRDGEASVRAGHASDWRQRQDQSRRDLLGDRGWILRVLSSFDIFRRPEATVELVRSALRRAGASV